MDEHGFGGTGTVAILLLAVLLGGLGALRWDALLLWFKSSFLAPPAEPALMQIVSAHRHQQAPQRLHQANLQQVARHRRPEFHRSGRRT